MKILKFPIIPIALLFCLGIVFNYYWEPDFYWVLANTIFTSLLFGIHFWLSKKHFLQKNFFGISTYVLSFSLGILTHSLHYEPKYENHYTHFISNSNTIEGTISERLKPNAYCEKYYFKISKIDGKEVFGKLLLNVSKKEIKTLLNAGDKIIIRSDLQPIAKAFNPYQFDYAAYLEKQNVYHQLYLKNNNFKVIATEKNFDFYVENYRNKLLKSFEMHQYPESASNIIKALLLGQRQDMDNETAQNYTSAGVIHILAISGLHIAILYAMLLVFIKPMKRIKNGKLFQFLIVLGFLWTFAILSGLSASVVRSVVMFSFMSLGLYLNKSANIYNSLAVSMLVILLLKPNFLFDVGFQLSYIAVFSIVWLQPLFKSHKRSRYRIINYFIDLIVISLVAQIGVLPLTLYYFNQFPTLFLLANFVVIPLSSLILVYGIFILLLNFIWMEASLFLGKLLSFLINVMNDYITWIASFDGFTLKNIPFSFGLMTTLYLLITSLFLWFYKKNFKRFMSLLVVCILFQLTFLFTLSETKNQNEFIIFNNKRSSLLAEKRNDKIITYSNDRLLEDNITLNTYNRGNFNRQIEIHPLQNVSFYNNKHILIIDSAGIYKIKKHPEIVLLTQSPKINLSRLIIQLKPKEIVADGSNYKSYIKRWKETCEKEKIPFHATAEKGFYRIEN